MKSVGEIYYERGIYFFELEQYEQAVEDWICAYELGYNTVEILQNLYQCFVIPNENEFQENYKENGRGITQIAFDDCELDFIPVNEKKYYIFDREEACFKGTFVLEETQLKEENVGFKSVLYTDTWDVREIVLDIKQNCYERVYLLLEKFECKFVSFFKLPLFGKLYMEKIILFHNIISMKDFLIKHSYRYFPKQMITYNPEKYTEIINEIQMEKRRLNGKNVLFLMGQSQYGALRRLINELAFAFRKIGYNILVLDMLQESFWQKLCAAKDCYEFDAVITCNLLGCEVEIIRHIGKKYCSIMGDHPIWLTGRLPYADDNTILWYGDWYNSDYVRKYYPNVKKVNIFMGSSDYLEESVEYSQRKYNLVFIGSYSRPDKLYEQICSMYSGNILNIVKDFIKISIQYPSKTYEQALKDVLDDYGLNTIEDKQFNEIAEEFRLVNKYVRAYFRDKIIRQIIENDIVIHVSGNGWEEFETECKNNIVIENNDWYTAKKLIANAKITLNILPWFKAGFHDRAVASLLSGSTLLTDSSEYIRQDFQDMENLVIYRLEKLEELPSIIKYLLYHEEVAEKIAMNGHNIAMKKCTWDSFARQMVDSLNEEIGEQPCFTEPGEELILSLDNIQKKDVALDILEQLKEIEQILDSFETGTTSELIRAKDYEYCVSKLKEVTWHLISYFPDVEVGKCVWNTISDLHDPVSADIPELIRMQIGYLVKVTVWDCLGM